MQMSAFKRVTLRAVALPFFAWTLAQAQTSAGGSIRGRVADPSGSVISAAAVLARSPNVAGVFHAVTDAEGNYRLLDLPPATDYEVTAEKPGFRNSNVKA